VARKSEEVASDDRAVVSVRVKPTLAAALMAYAKEKTGIQTTLSTAIRMALNAELKRSGHLKEEV
jgi:hypothetical protein